MIPMLFAAVAAAEIIDRVAVVLDRYAITLSMVDEEIRVTAFQEQQAVQINAASRREAAERLLEQELVHREVQASRYPEPSEESVEQLLAAEKKANPDFQAALVRYGLKEPVLRARLAREQMLVDFVRQRFLSERELGEVPDEKALNERIEKALGDWLEQIKKSARIRWIEEAFQ
jgi:hypothetical protein